MARPHEDLGSSAAISFDATPRRAGLLRTLVALFASLISLEVGALPPPIYPLVVLDLHVGASGVIVISHPSAGLFRSTDDGDSWQRVHASTYRDPFHIFDGAQHGLFAIGKELLNSRDNGATWQRVETWRFMRGIAPKQTDFVPQRWQEARRSWSCKAACPSIRYRWAHLPFAFECK